jgi:hypothetical protein
MKLEGVIISKIKIAEKRGIDQGGTTGTHQ